ncbi:DUF3099 domain-containing protein [Marisediminicola senii]|uniref:DUF3099 domain-containing protein n=1 Tax=Marisediminicola senii TaxID=2711233 RepID=UPI0013EA216C|nr:DUF3099 domain-containing protein [Marisediminicola senii]
MAKQQVISSITALPRSPQDDRHDRMIKYLIAMAVRLVCIAMCFFVTGWWLAVFAIAAIVLPYFAVILANVGHQVEGQVERPGSIVPLQQRERPVDGDLL